MDIDPTEYTEQDEQVTTDARRARLNGLVAVTVALLATFLAICNVKDGNIVQGMQQAQAKSIDDWAWYQAKKTRVEMLDLARGQLALQKNTSRAVKTQLTEYEKKLSDDRKELDEKQADAKADEAQYDALNYHDDQFDAAEAMLSLAVSLLAVTSLTQKRWLYWVALVPTALGVLFGLSGLLGWRIHPDLLARWLS